MSSLSSKFSSFQIWRPVQIWEIFGQTSRVVLLGSVTQTVRCQCMLYISGVAVLPTLVWYAMVWMWYMVWRKLVYYGMAKAWHGNTTVWKYHGSMVWHGMVWYGMIWHCGVAPRDANSARTRRWLGDPLCYFYIYTTINIIIAYISLKVNFASHHHCRHLPPHHRLSCRWPVEGLLQLLVAEGNLTSSAVFGRRTLDNTLLWSFAV